MQMPLRAEESESPAAGGCELPGMGAGNRPQAFSPAPRPLPKKRGTVFKVCYPSLIQEEIIALNKQTNKFHLEITKPSQYRICFCNAAPPRRKTVLGEGPPLMGLAGSDLSERRTREKSSQPAAVDALPPFLPKAEAQRPPSLAQRGNWSLEPSAAPTAREAALWGLGRRSLPGNAHTTQSPAPSSCISCAHALEVLDPERLGRLWSSG